MPIVISRSTRVRAMCAMPSDISRRKRCDFTAAGGSSNRSATSVAAEPRKLAASTSATTPPPNAA